MNDPFPVSESLLCYFVASLARQGLAPTTIQTYLAVVYHAQIIGASVSEPLPSDVNVDLVCLSVMDRRTYAMATAHASHFLHVAVYVTMVTLFRQNIDNTYSTHLRDT